MGTLIYKMLTRLSILVHEDPKKRYSIDPIENESLSRHCGFLSRTKSDFLTVLHEPPCPEGILKVENM